MSDQKRSAVETFIHRNSWVFVRITTDAGLVGWTAARLANPPRGRGQGGRGSTPGSDRGGTPAP